MYDTQVLAVVMGMIGVLAVVSVALYVLSVVAYWQIFKKAGEKGWKAIIPIYNSYIVYKISWKTSMFWVMILLGVVYAILNTIAVSADIAVLSVLAYIIYIAVLIIAIVAVHKLSKAFGHGVGFTLGLLFLSPIFLLILAFGSSQYVGKGETENVIEQ